MIDDFNGIGKNVFDGDLNLVDEFTSSLTTQFRNACKVLEGIMMKQSVAL